jgi:hypothetical protein
VGRNRKKREGHANALERLVDLTTDSSAEDAGVPMKSPVRQAGAEALDVFGNPSLE